MVAMDSKTKFIGPSSGQRVLGGMREDSGKGEWAGISPTERSIIIPLFGRDSLLEKRTCLLERLAECANEIKQIDEQLKLI